MSSKSSIKGVLKSVKSAKSSRSDLAKSAKSSKSDFAKSVKSSKSHKAKTVDEEDPSIMSELASKITGGNVKNIRKVRQDGVEIIRDNAVKLLNTLKRNKAADQEKVPISFENAVNYMPLNSWLAYELNKTYTDRKTGELKRVYCNSAFYKGTYTRTSGSLVNGQGKVIENILIFVANNREWHLSQREIHKLWLYKCTDYINFDLAKYTERRLAESQIKRSRSLNSLSNRKSDSLESKKVSSLLSSRKNSPLTRTKDDSSFSEKKIGGKTAKSSKNSETTKKLLRRPRSSIH